MTGAIADAHDPLAGLRVTGRRAITLLLPRVDIEVLPRRSRASSSGVGASLHGPVMATCPAQSRPRVAVVPITMTTSHGPGKSETARK